MRKRYGPALAVLAAAVLYLLSARSPGGDPEAEHRRLVDAALMYDGPLEAFDVEETCDRW